MMTPQNGRIGAANRDNNRAFQIMWTGSILNVDSWVILKSSPNKEKAVSPFEFLGCADRHLEWPGKLGYGLGNVEAQPSRNPQKRSRAISIASTISSCAGSRRWRTSDFCRARCCPERGTYAGCRTRFSLSHNQSLSGVWKFHIPGFSLKRPKARGPLPRRVRFPR